jgi:hypothetical protein
LLLGLKVSLHVRRAFNYTRGNNQAVTLTRRPLLLLNNDFEPITPGWLDHMVAHMDDARIGIVGPRQLYPDGTVQHGGKVMGRNGPNVPMAAIAPPFSTGLGTSLHSVVRCR